MRNHMAYQGTIFTIEWYYNEKGSSQSMDYFLNLDRAGRDKTIRLFRGIGDCRSILNKSMFRHEGDTIFAFKPGRLPVRFLCFFGKGGRIIVTNAFRKKKSNKLKIEKKRAMKCREDYIKRTEEKLYYKDEKTTSRRPSRIFAKTGMGNYPKSHASNC